MMQSCMVPGGGVRSLSCTDQLASIEDALHGGSAQVAKREAARASKLNLDYIVKEHGHAACHITLSVLLQQQQHSMNTNLSQPINSGTTIKDAAAAAVAAD